MTRDDAERLAAGTAFLDISRWRAIALIGSDALTWLNDLISADIDGMAPGRSKRSLLLGPTGGVLASFTVAAPRGSLLILQDPAEPRPIDRLLSPYVLSSDVRIEDRTGDVAVFAFPGRREAPDAPATTPSMPSALGRGVDVVASAEDHDRLVESFAERFTQATDASADAWRIWAGIPRIGVDALDGDLPPECGLGDAVSFEKGCFLGQEAVAKARNLGHPRRLLVPFTSERPVSVGEEVLAGRQPAGMLTSVGRFDGSTLALGRIGWEHRGASLRTAGGASLRPRENGPPPIG